jgi:hypothetical protein
MICGKSKATFLMVLLLASDLRRRFSWIKATIFMAPLQLKRRFSWPKGDVFHG